MFKNLANFDIGLYFNNRKCEYNHVFGVDYDICYHCDICKHSKKCRKKYDSIITKHIFGG